MTAFMRLIQTLRSGLDFRHLYNNVAHPAQGGVGLFWRKATLRGFR